LKNCPKKVGKLSGWNVQETKKRGIKVFEETVKLRGYKGEIRQVNITGHGKIKPASCITKNGKIRRGNI
jgi:hypothetical protein